MDTTWFRLCPLPLRDDPALGSLAGVLARPEVVAALQHCEARGHYPSAILHDLRQAGLASLFVEDQGDGPVTAYHLAALNALAARRSGSLAISLGIFGLSLLPLYLDGSPEQQAFVYERLRAGAVPAMLLTEWDHGSDLLANQTRATLEGNLYRLEGEKHLINGGHQASLLFVLARSGDPVGGDGIFGAAPPFTVLLVERDASVVPLPRLRTLPCPAADISGVRFEGTRVPTRRVVGKPDQGFALIQRVLTISRAGIGSLASGAASRAWELAFTYARERQLYGAPLVALRGLSDHLLELAALDHLTAAIALKATAMVNARGQAAAYWTAVAKFAACDLAEQAVEEGRRLWSARALVHEMPYAQLVRDVLLYGVFDGTRHVMLEQISWLCAQMATRPTEVDAVETAREVYGQAPAALGEVARRRRRPLLISTAGTAKGLAELPGQDLGPLVQLAEGALTVARVARARPTWSEDQGLRFALAEPIAHIEALLALVELADPDRRPALGMSRPDAWTEAVYRFAVPWFGLRLVDRVKRLAQRAGTEVEVDDTAWVRRLEPAREALYTALIEA